MSPLITLAIYILVAAIIISVIAVAIALVVSFIKISDYDYYHVPSGMMVIPPYFTNETGIPQNDTWMPIMINRGRDGSVIEAGFIIPGEGNVSGKYVAKAEKLFGISVMRKIENPFEYATDMQMYLFYVNENGSIMTIRYGIYHGFNAFNTLKEMVRPPTEFPDPLPIGPAP